MSATDFNDLIRHEEHEITIATYYDINLNTINVAIECMDCHEVLLDFDKDAYEPCEAHADCGDCLEYKAPCDNHNDCGDCLEGVE